MSFSSFITSGDLFSHQVNLSFNKKAGNGNEHKTIIGGSISLIVKAFMAIYLYELVIKMLYRLDNKNESFSLMSDTD